MIEQGEPEKFLFLIIIIVLVGGCLLLATRIDMYRYERKERILSRYPKDVQEFMI